MRARTPITAPGAATSMIAALLYLGTCPDNGTAICALMSTRPITPRADAWLSAITRAPCRKVKYDGGMLLLCSLKPHKLYRFCTGDHYAKGKSITDDC